MDSDDIAPSRARGSASNPARAANVEEVDSRERRADPRLKLEIPDDQVARRPDPDRVHAMERLIRPSGSDHVSPSGSKRATCRT